MDVWGVEMSASLIGRAACARGATPPLGTLEEAPQV